MREKEICFIMCVNKEEYKQEALHYITHLNVPDGYTINFLAVESANQWHQVTMKG